MHRDGYVVVRRAWGAPPKTGARRIRNAVGWTLHVSTCAFVKRAKRNVQPAPAVDYAGTVPCQYCKPEMGV